MTTTLTTALSNSVYSWRAALGLTYIRLNSNSEICTTKNVIVNLYVEITMKHKIFYHSFSAPSLMLNVFLSGGLARFSFFSAGEKRFSRCEKLLSFPFPRPSSLPLLAPFYTFPVLALAPSLLLFADTIFAFFSVSDDKSSSSHHAREVCLNDGMKKYE